MYETLIANKNAVKYSDSEVINTLLDICNKAKNENCYFIGQAIRDKLSKGQFDYLTSKYQGTETVSGTLKELYSICETNLVTAMLEGRVKETASIFLLKCKYGWIDKQQIEIEHKGSVNVNFNFPEDDPYPHRNPNPLIEI